MQPSPRKRKQPDSLDGPAVGTRGRHTKTESEDYEEFAAKAAAAEAAAMMANLRRSQEQARLHAQQQAAAEAAAAAAASAVTAAQQPPPPPPLQQRELERRRSCCCKKSHCLKLYCECFAGGDMCDEDNCRCTNCRNTVRFDRERLAAVEAAQEKNKDACRPKTAQSVKQHNKGCQCKKSSCLKRYCECFQANIKCSDQCRCTDCRNGSDADDGASSSSGGGSSQATVDASLPSSQASNARKRGRPRRTASSTDVQERNDAWPLPPQRAHGVLPGFNEFQPDFEAARNMGNGFGAQYVAPVSVGQQRTTGGFITDDMLKGLCDTLLAAAAQAGSPATPYGSSGGDAMHIAQSATASIRQPSWGVPTPGKAEPRDPKRPVSPDTAQLLCSENEAEEEDKCGRWEWARSGGGSSGGGSSGRGGSGGGGGRVVVQKCSVELYSFPDRTMTARP